MSIKYNKFLDRCGKCIRGILNGFDRIVFKGTILPLSHAGGVVSFLQRNNILNKDYKTWITQQTGMLIDAVESYVKDQCGQPIYKIDSWRIRKETLAHEHQNEVGITRGLIGCWKCQELGRSYRACFKPGATKPEIKSYRPQCNHLYLYYDHKDYGFMNIRLQTWFPFHVQICLNGREWLRRRLEKKGVEFYRNGNKFLHIADFGHAQKILNTQLDTQWDSLLNSFMFKAFPTMNVTLGDFYSYYWTLWQSEWATDFIFDSPLKLNALMDTMIHHAVITNTSDRIMRYFDRPLTKNGKPYSHFAGEVVSRFAHFNDGLRLRHWCEHNSVKMYNEKNNLRIESTINNPGAFKVYRHAQNEDCSKPKKLRSLRKGVADTSMRCTISDEINKRYISNLADMTSDQPVHKIMDQVCKASTKNGKRTRALDPIGKDRDLLTALSDHLFTVNGLTNKMLREKLADTQWGKGRTEKQLSYRITRHLSLLRRHGIIKKIPNRNAYHVTKKGQTLTNALQAILHASTEKLCEFAA